MQPMDPSDTRDVDALREVIRLGAIPDYLFFWGHRPRAAGRLDAACFSQWWMGHPFEEDGVSYPSAEHYMMASKARLFGDEEHLEAILGAPDPGAAKRLGRKVRGFDEGTWRRHRVDLVVAGNVAKFSQHPALRALLLDTGAKVLVEASPRDRIWGIGLGASSGDARRPERWPGLNLLGFALMEARQRLIDAA